MNDPRAKRPHDLQLNPERIAELQPSIRRLEVLLSTERYDAALAVIEELRWQSPSIPDASSSIADCGVPVRMLNALESIGVLTVRQLADCRTLDLMSIRNTAFQTISRTLQTVIEACAPVGCPRRGIRLTDFVKSRVVGANWVRQKLADCRLHTVECLVGSDLSRLRGYCGDLEVISVLQQTVRAASERGGR